MATSTADEPKLPGGYLVTPRVPQGLAAAVEGLTREVIRHSPEDIYVFAAHHFEKLLHLREQCGGVEKDTDRDSNLRALREMSQALKMREIDRGNVRMTRNTVDQVGWSLNQTAKVLKRHRSIFGDAGRRISTDEVFRMANQKENQGRSSKSPAEKIDSRVNRLARQKISDENVDNLWKASTSRTDRSWSNEESVDTNETNSETRSGPRIITQIPSLPSGTGMLAKDIKTELRKNRISSRERRSVRAKPEDRTTVERSGKVVSSRKSSDRQQKRMESEIEQKRSNRNVDSTRSSKERQGRRSEGEDSSLNNGKKMESRAMSMDQVKDYVVQRFATTKSLEELQSVNYVEKVQEIIDETGPIIKGKVDELKSGMIGRSKRSSWFANASNPRGSNEHNSPRDSADSRVSRVPTSDELKTKLTETQNLMENVSSSLTRSHRRSRSARSSRRSKANATIHEDLSKFADSCEEITASISDPSNRASGLENRLSKTRNLLEDISSTLSRPMRRSCSAKYLRKYDDGTTDDSSDFGTKGDALKTRLDETRHLLEGLSATFAMPGHRAGSAKGSRNRSSASANINNDEFSHSDSTSASKVSLPAVRSVSVKSSSGSVSRSDSVNLVLPAISPEAPKSAKIKEDLVLPILSPPGTGSSNEDSKIVEVTDVLEELDIPEIPVEEYIPEVPMDDVFRDSLNVTPNFDSIPQRPDSLEPEETPEDIKETAPKVDDLEGRLQEIQKVEKDIEDIFGSKSSHNPEAHEDVESSNIKKKLQELEEAEKRIDRILDTEIGNEGKDSPSSERDDIIEIVDESGDAEGVVGEETRIKRAIPNDIDQVELGVDEQKMDKLSAVSPESLNYTYVLTEGSPYDIPDTVTTVIIPERPIESPEFSPVDVELRDVLEEKLDSLPESAKSKGSIEGVECVVEDLVETNVADEVKADDESSEDVKEETNITIESKDVSQANVLSPKIQSDLFGELVKPEMTETTSPDIDFIRDMENRHDVQIAHQDLGRISEEVSEELEDLEVFKERKDGTKGSKKVEIIEENNEETLEEVDVESREDKQVAGDDVEVDKSKEKTDHNEGNEVVNDEVGDVDKSKEKTESDFSPIASRPDLDSESSNEAKESSAIDEPLESAKCGISLEEASSETRTPESSNEVKETTLTDGLSLSLDPMRPYVPELNLDSLQDITVSSFKMTEDEYENPCKAESENTNSITETLTSDENNRLNDNAEFAEEAILEFIVSSPDQSKVDEQHGESQHSENLQEEIIEDPITKSQVEIKEDICEKVNAYVTEPNNEKDNIAIDESKSLEVQQVPEADEEIEKEVVNDESKISDIEQEHEEREVVNVVTKLPEVDQDTQDEEQGQREVVNAETKLSEVEQDAQGETEDTNDETNLSEEPQDTRSEEEDKEFAIEEAKVSAAPENVKSEEETKEVEPEEAKLSEVEKNGKSEEENKEGGGLQASPAQENIEDESVVKDGAKDNVESQSSTETQALENVTIQESANKSLTEDEVKDNVESQSSIEVQALESATIEESTNKSLAEDEVEKVIETESPVGKEDIAVEVTKKDEHEALPDEEEQRDVQTENVEVQAKEEIKEDVVENGSPGVSVENAEGDNKVEVQSMDDTNKSDDFAGECRSPDDGNDEIPEKEHPDGESERVDAGTKEEIKENVIEDESSGIAVENAEGSDNKVAGQSSEEVNKSGDLEGELRTEEDANDETLEESFVEEETPLAVSRSASQCTTRRVSSGNLARLREDPSISWAEEVGPEAEDEEDQISSKVKFSKIGGETIREQGSDEIDQSADSDSPKNVSDEINTTNQSIDSLTKDSKAYHIYVPDVDAGDDSSTTDSSTVESAVTKIQARVRGFLTRRRLHRGQHNRSSTLGSIPSIQDSVAIDPEKEDVHGLVNAATRIQMNYRRYKARNRLRREDAVQRTTLSLDKSFAESGLQHTGEFHDCVPLPIHDLSLEKRSSILSTDGKSNLISGSVPSGAEKISEKISPTKAQQPVHSDGEDSPKNLHGNVDETVDSDNIGQMYFGQTSNVPIIKFGMSQNLGHIVDLVVLAKEEAALQSGYLNFITSVEDTDDVDAASAVPMKLKDFAGIEENSNESFKEPLALSATPIGVVIEEVTSSGADNFMKSDDATMTSTVSSAAPEIGTESLSSLRAPCASSECLSMSMDDRKVDDHASEVQEPKIEGSKVEEHVVDNSERPEDSQDPVESGQTKSLSSDGSKIDENLVLPTDSLIEDLLVPENFSLSGDRGFLGPESSVDSMECPAVPSEDKNSSGSSGKSAEASGVTRTVAERSAKEAESSEPKEENPTDEKSVCSNVDDSSSILSFSMKVQDFLGLGSEDSMEMHGRKPILEVTLTPGDLMKSKSQSQESQLAGERIESPITMVQMTPGRSESLQQEDLSENGCEDEKPNGKARSSSAKSEKNVET